MGRTSNAKELLLAAALDLVWSRSYGVVTIDAICEKAGVKKGSFYYFFESKSDLAVAALNESWESRGKPKWDGYFSASMPPLERIRNFFKATHDNQEIMQKEQGAILGCPCFSVGSETCTQDDAIRDKVQEILQRQTRYFESAIRDAQAEGLVPPGDAAIKAKCLFALFEGSLGQARIHNDLSYLRDLPDTAMDILGAKRLQPLS